MFTSLLNAITSNSLILDILIVLAIVIAGSLIFYFLWEAACSAIEKSNKMKSERQTDDLKFEAVDEKGMTKFSLDKEDEVTAQPVNEESNEETQTVEETITETPVEEKVETFDEAHLQEVDENKAVEEEQTAKEEISEEERENAERRAYLEARRQELLRRMQEQEEEEEEQTTETETVEETVEEEQPVEEEVESDALREEREALETEKAKYAAMVEELEKARQALAEAQQTVVAPKVEPVQTNALAGLSIAELKERLATAETRLKETEKEFKQCKKEFLPLQKVWVTYEKDAKKLRRKEALVARQKVLLYGVNNYSDIDEEKAKKLSEDLDLLDGLKLSVQHCEEVMKNNQERYPLLEKMYKVLKIRDEELRGDIERLQAEIARLESEN